MEPKEKAPGVQAESKVSPQEKARVYFPQILSVRQALGRRYGENLMRREAIAFGGDGDPERYRQLCKDLAADSGRILYLDKLIALFGEDPAAGVGAIDTCHRCKGSGVVTQYEAPDRDSGHPGGYWSEECECMSLERILAWAPELFQLDKAA